jgi:WD40 repeat protein
MIGHKSPISGVATYSDLFVASAGYDNHVILWDIRTGRALSRGSHDHLVNHCAFNADGTSLVTSSSDYTARVWKLPCLSLQAVLKDHDDDVEMAVFHPSKDLIATASRDHCVRVYSKDGLLLKKFKGHTADVISVEWIAGSTELISSGDDGTIRRWSLNEDSETQIYDLEGVETDTIVVTPVGVIYAGTDSGEIVALLGGARSSTMSHSAGIKRLAYSDRLQMLVSLSYDRTLKIWNCFETGLTLVKETDIPPDVWPRSCAFGPNNSLIFGSFGARYRQYYFKDDFWDTPAPLTFGINAVCVFNGARYTIGDAGILWRNGVKHRELGSLCNFLVPWGSCLLTGGQNGVLFDAFSGETIFEHDSPLNCGTTYTVEGEQRAVIGTYTGEGLVFRRSNSNSKIEILASLNLHSNAVKGLAYAAGRLFSVCADTSCTWTDATTNVVQHHSPRSHCRIANACVALQDNSFASVSRDKILRIWVGRQSLEFITPHSHSIKCVAVDNSDRYIATGSYGGYVAIFDRITHTWVLYDRSAFAGISSLFFDTESRCFIASTYDGNVVEVRNFETP